MTKDSLVFGGLAGVIGNIFKEAITWGLYFGRVLNYTFVHFCAGVVINPASQIKDPISIIIGIIIDYTVAASFSVAMYLIMRKTGTDHWLLKSLFFGMMVFIICYGILRPAISIKIESPPLVALMYLIPNLAYGVGTCWFLNKYGSFKVFGR